jgi:hypothetical protein
MSSLSGAARVSTIVRFQHETFTVDLWTDIDRTIQCSGRRASAASVRSIFERKGSVLWVDTFDGISRRDDLAQGDAPVIGRDALVPVGAEAGGV